MITFYGTSKSYSVRHGIGRSWAQVAGRLARLQSTAKRRRVVVGQEAGPGAAVLALLELPSRTANTDAEAGVRAWEAQSQPIATTC